jgi:hypothetical protein
LAALTASVGSACATIGTSSTTTVASTIASTIATPATAAAAAATLRDQRHSFALVNVGPFSAKHVEKDALVSSDQGDYFGGQAVERDFGDKRLGHRVLVSHIVFEKLGCQSPEVVVVHGLIASWIL